MSQLILTPSLREANLSKLTKIKVSWWRRRKRILGIHTSWQWIETKSFKRTKIQLSKNNKRMRRMKEISIWLVPKTSNLFSFETMKILGIPWFRLKKWLILFPRRTKIKSRLIRDRLKKIRLKRELQNCKKKNKRRLIRQEMSFWHQSHLIIKLYRPVNY